MDLLREMRFCVDDEIPCVSVLKQGAEKLYRFWELDLYAGQGQKDERGLCVLEIVKLSINALCVTGERRAIYAIH